MRGPRRHCGRAHQPPVVDGWLPRTAHRRGAAGQSDIPVIPLTSTEPTSFAHSEKVRHIILTTVQDAGRRASCGRVPTYLHLGGDATRGRRWQCVDQHPANTSVRRGLIELSAESKGGIGWFDRLRRQFHPGFAAKMSLCAATLMRARPKGARKVALSSSRCAGRSSSR